MTATPAGNEPHRPDPADGTLTPTAPGTTPTKPALKLTRPQKILIVVIGAGVLTIAALGFIGSYDAVTALAHEKHFGDFARAFPIAVDAGIIAFLALDLLLTWLRMSYPLLRQGAWLLTAATISFNASTAYPDKLGMGMHGIIPILFIIAIEAARHAIGRIAQIAADKHLEGPNASRWLLNPVATFILWRRQRLWKIRDWDTVLGLEQERRIYIGKLRQQHGRRSWRRKATSAQMLILSLAKDGMSVTEAMALPEREAAKQRAEEDRIADEKQAAETKRRNEREAHAREQKRLNDEAANKAEAARIANQREALAAQQQEEDADRKRRIADAQTQAELAAIARREKDAEAAATLQREQAQTELARQQARADRESRQAQAEFERQQEQRRLEAATALADEQQRAATAALTTKDAAEEARREAEKKLTVERRTAEVRTALANQNREPRTTNHANPNLEPARTSTPRTSTGTTANPGTPNREPAPNQPATRVANPANLNDRAATKQNQITTVLELIDELGFDATTLGVVMDRTGMSKTTAYHRLTEARGVWNQRKAS